MTFQSLRDIMADAALLLLRDRRDVTRAWYAHARQPWGWRCTHVHLDGPCALVPRWWNLWGWYWGRTR